MRARFTNQRTLSVRVATHLWVLGARLRAPTRGASLRRIRGAGRSLLRFRCCRAASRRTSSPAVRAWTLPAGPVLPRRRRGRPAAARRRAATQLKAWRRPLARTGGAPLVTGPHRRTVAAAASSHDDVPPATPDRPAASAWCTGAGSSSSPTTAGSRVFTPSRTEGASFVGSPCLGGSFAVSPSRGGGGKGEWEWGKNGIETRRRRAAAPSRHAAAPACTAAFELRRSGKQL